MNGTQNTAPTSTPTKDAKPPRIPTPSQVSASPARACAPTRAIVSTPVPPTKSTRAKPSRSLPAREATSGASSGRNAAIGLTCVAARAGTSAASTVTTTPTSIGTSRTEGVTVTYAGSGMSSCMRPSTDSAPCATPVPRSTPTTDAPTPRIAASSSTDRRSWPRTAPTQRSSARVRARWATRTWNVFEMTRPATIRETAAKARIDPTTKFSPPPVSSIWSSAASSRVWTVTGARSLRSAVAASSMVRSASSTVAVSRGALTSAPSLPTRSGERFVHVSTESCTARVAPPKPVQAPPGSAVRPVTVTSRVRYTGSASSGHSVQDTSTVPPTSTSSRSATPRGSAISSAPCGARPSAIVSEDRLGSEATGSMSCHERDAPLRTSRPPMITGSTASTPGTARIWSRSPVTSPSTTRSAWANRAVTES